MARIINRISAYARPNQTGKTDGKRLDYIKDMVSGIFHGDGLLDSRANSLARLLADTP